MGLYNKFLVRGFTTLPERSVVHGFTLIELLMVMSIMGALAAVMLFHFPASQRRARDAQRRNDIKQYQTAIEAYANENNGMYPNDTTGSTLPTVCESFLNTVSCPDDPRPPSHYFYMGDNTNYVLWMTLEQPQNQSTPYWVVCSNGATGESATEPASAVCPI